MKINYPDVIELFFKDLVVGEVFAYKDKIILMKTKTLTLANGTLVNAVVLENGTFMHINSLDMTTPIKAELNIKGE